ncbi:hypothetical protein [Peribacillus kribbensis]|nr:hypothetical protein [Peribacillus kribbensis]
MKKFILCIALGAVLATAFSFTNVGYDSSIYKPSRIEVILPPS